MPGIYGYIKRIPSEESMLIAMTGAMKSSSHYIQDIHYMDSIVAASRVHLGHIGEENSPYHDNDVRVWVEGEAYNVEEVADKLRLKERRFAATLVEAYQTGRLDNLLNLLDGYFCAALYDKKEKKLRLITDRFGMRMLYWYWENGLFAWASEVKGILAIESIDKNIDKTSPQCFLDLGYLMGERTWFEHIKLIKPATVLEFDIASKKIEQRHYWNWSEIQPSNLTFNQSVDELNTSFIEAVKRRFDPTEEIGIAMSGGLDSRAILAAANQLCPDYQGYSYTFGRPGCDDIKIAERAISVSNWKHQVFHLNEKNWFAQPIEQIWNTDGMLDVMHMHGSQFLNEIAKNINVNLNGYCGDAILGGGFLKRVPFNKRISATNSKSFYKHYWSHSMADAAFYDIDHVEPNLYMNRVRRFTNMGSVNWLAKVDQRKPFFDNTIVELIFSLPDEYRLNNELYAAMLLKYFPKYFIDIPWQKTGYPISYHNIFIKTLALKNRLLGRLKREVARVGIKYKDLRSFTDYAEWLRKEPACSFFKKVLSAKNAIYPEYINKANIHRYLEDHLQKRSNSHEILCRALTFEIYLQQVFEGRYRGGLF